MIEVGADDLARSPTSRSGMADHDGVAIIGVALDVAEHGAHGAEPLGRDPRGADLAVAPASGSGTRGRWRSARRTSRGAGRAGPVAVAEVIALRSGTSHSASSASWSSSTSRTVGATSSVAAAIAASSSVPSASAPAVPDACAGRPRRSCTARVRRSSSGASSRNAYGLALSSSCDSGLGSTVSRAMTWISPRSSRSSIARRPSQSIASTRQSRMVSNTSG